MNSALVHIFLSLRPKQWIKNLFVFAPLVFARALTEGHLVLLTVLAFTLFCAASSSIYVVNDLLDKHKDRLHPTKKHRPIAAGKLSPFLAVGAAVFLGGASLVLGFLVEPLFGAVLAGYILLQVAYSLFLKHLIILDVFSIATGFVLRVAGGAAMIAVPISVWIVLCTFFLTLFLGVHKRRGEWELNQGESRDVLRGYSKELFEHISAVSLSATLITYVFYTFSSEHSKLLMLTIPLVLYGLLSYTNAIAGGPKGDCDPTEVLWRERNLQVTILLWALVSGGILLFTR